MLSYPTDLSSEKTELAQARLRELAEKLTHEGILRTKQWREVFTRTWRHPYVPSLCSLVLSRAWRAPPAWLKQTASGGMIMADVRGKIGGTVVRLTADGDGTATGHFLPGYGSFMPLRHTLDIPLTGADLGDRRRTGGVSQPR